MKKRIMRSLLVGLIIVSLGTVGVYAANFNDGPAGPETNSTHTEGND